MPDIDLKRVHHLGMKAARAAGVEVLACAVTLSAQGLAVSGLLPVLD